MTDSRIDTINELKHEYLLASTAIELQSVFLGAEQREPCLDDQPTLWRVAWLRQNNHWEVMGTDSPTDEMRLGLLYAAIHFVDVESEVPFQYLVIPQSYKRMFPNIFSDYEKVRVKPDLPPFFLDYFFTT